MLSTIGSTSTQVAYPLLILALTHSPAKAGAVGFANLAPYALFALFAGVAADRWNRKSLMIAADGVLALALASLAAAILAGHIQGRQFGFFGPRPASYARRAGRLPAQADAAHAATHGGDAADRDRG